VFANHENRYLIIKEPVIEGAKEKYDANEKPVAAIPTRRQMIFASWTKDVLIYIIVLNLFVEFNSKIIIDSFTISIFTAILLKILLEVILKLEHTVSERFKSYRALRIFLVWLVLSGCDSVSDRVDGRQRGFSTDLCFPWQQETWIVTTQSGTWA
jgi:hypothetical protein